MDYGDSQSVLRPRTTALIDKKTLFLVFNPLIVNCVAQESEN